MRIECLQRAACTHFTFLSCAALDAHGTRCDKDVGCTVRKPDTSKYLHSPIPGSVYVAKSTLGVERNRQLRGVKFSYRVLLLRNPIEQGIALADEAFKWACGQPDFKRRLADRLAKNATSGLGGFDAVVFVENAYSDPIGTLRSLGFFGASSERVDAVKRRIAELDEAHRQKNSNIQKQQQLRQGNRSALRAGTLTAAAAAAHSSPALKMEQQQNFCVDSPFICKLYEPFDSRVAKLLASVPSSPSNGTQVRKSGRKSLRQGATLG